jgi:hypothetical protein
MIFVISVGQHEQSLHDELRADVDHGSISGILYHPQIQESLLLRVAEKVGVVKTSDIPAHRNHSRSVLRNQSFKAGGQNINGFARGAFVALPPQNSGNDALCIDRSEEALFLNDFSSGLVHP